MLLKHGLGAIANRFKPNSITFSKQCDRHAQSDRRQQTNPMHQKPHYNLRQRNGETECRWDSFFWFDTHYPSPLIAGRGDSWIFRRSAIPFPLSPSTSPRVGYSLAEFRCDSSLLRLEVSKDPGRFSFGLAIAKRDRAPPASRGDWQYIGNFLCILYFL